MQELFQQTFIEDFLLFHDYCSRGNADPPVIASPRRLGVTPAFRIPIILNHGLAVI